MKPLTRRRPRRIGREHVASWLVALLLAGPGVAAGQTGANVLVAINETSPASVEIGEYYASLRQVPAVNLVRLNTATSDSVTRAQFEETIARPIQNWLVSNQLQDQVLYIVLTKGVPLRIDGTTGLDGTMASVDSELTLLYRRLLGIPDQMIGRIDNPYFLAERPASEARPFTRMAQDIYLVTRLDGFSVTDVRRLIERSLHPSREGRVVLDQRAAGGDRGGDRWLEQTADRLHAAGAGDRVLLESTRAVATADGPVLGYFSWGSNDPANRLRSFGMAFVPGALGGMFVSTDGRTFTAPPEDWRPAAATGRGYGIQSLAGDLIRDGITGVSAHVAEPYLDATVRPQVLFPAYLAGFNLAEAFYLSMPYLGWQSIVVGDPLCAPFRQRILPPSEIYGPLDEETDLPQIFSNRLVARLSGPGLNPQAVKKELLAESRLRTGDEAAAVALLTEAVALEPSFTAAGLALAGIYERQNANEKAVEVYRQIVAADPRNVIALNNLAYALSVRLNRVEEALPFAERAAGIAPIAESLDTLGWIHSLLGDNQTASRHLERAVALAPKQVEILVHAATVSAALGDRIRARRHLDNAVAEEPGLAGREDVVALRAKIGGEEQTPGWGRLFE